MGNSFGTELRAMYNDHAVASLDTWSVNTRMFAVRVDPPTNEDFPLCQVSNDQFGVY